MNAYALALLTALKLLAGLGLLLLVLLGFYLRQRWVERRTMREMDGALSSAQENARRHMRTQEYRDSSMGRR